MIEMYRGADLERLRRAGQCAAQTLAATLARLKAGMSTADINRVVADDTAARGATPSQLGYHGFPGVVCVSRNDVVCHGVPSETEFLGNGDIVNVDVTSCLDGFHGDTSKTVCIGEVCADRAHVVDVVERCLAAGIAVVRPGARVGDIGAAIVDVARAAGCSVVADFGGHGIGRQMHQDPHISHVGVRGRGPRLEVGMCFTIEPMVNAGRPEVRVLADGWRVVTADGSPSAQAEHTILVVDGGAEVLTLMAPAAKKTRAVAALG